MYHLEVVLCQATLCKVLEIAWGLIACDRELGGCGAFPTQIGTRQTAQTQDLTPLVFGEPRLDWRAPHLDLGASALSSVPSAATNRSRHQPCAGNAAFLIQPT